MLYIKNDTEYAKKLHDKLKFEQDSSVAASKMSEKDFLNFMETALYFMEKDNKIMWRTPPKDGDAMRDITGA